MVLLEVLLPIELGAVRVCSELIRIIALGVLTVAVEVDQERDLLSACLETNEGAGVLDLDPQLIDEGADEEDLLVEPIRQDHVVHDVSLELAPDRHRIVRCEGHQVEDRISVAVDIDEVAEEGHRVAIADLLIGDEAGILLLPPQSELVHLLPRDEERVVEDVVDRVDEAIIDLE